jgi:peptide deformylase
MSSTEFDPQQLTVITYPHPGLRHVAKPLRRVDATIKRIAERMVELMFAHSGVGLAATQVNIPLRMFVWNPTGKPDQGATTVVLNPTLTRPRGNEEAEEGCLSLPGMHADVVRAKSVHLHGYDIHGKEIDREFSGFEARILQHETDHLNGVLFIDRLSPEIAREHEEALAIFETDFASRQRVGAIPPQDQLRAGLVDWESRYS